MAFRATFFVLDMLRGRARHNSLLDGIQNNPSAVDSNQFDIVMNEYIPLLYLV